MLVLMVLPSVLGAAQPEPARPFLNASKNPFTRAAGELMQQTINQMPTAEVVGKPEPSRASCPAD